MAAIHVGKCAVVAGGARGIGRACALRLADLGARVAVLDRDMEAAKEFGEELTAASVEAELTDRAGDGLGLQVDLSDGEETEKAFAAVVDRWGRLDMLVVAAGGAVTPYPRSRASETSPEDFATLVAANMATVVNCARAAVPRMRANGGGAIVTVASGAALRIQPGGYAAGYAMTKAGVAHYSRYLATEVGPDGIRVNCIAPGVVRTSRVLAQAAVTGLVANEAGLATIPMRRQGEPSDIADAVEMLVGPHSAFITGQLIAVDGGASL